MISILLIQIFRNVQQKKKKTFYNFGYLFFDFEVSIIFFFQIILSEKILILS